jgi:hypothetical protein
MRKLFMVLAGVIILYLSSIIHREKVTPVTTNVNALSFVTPTFILPLKRLCRKVIARERSDRSNLTSL